MPKGYDSLGRAILTKEEFREIMMAMKAARIEMEKEGVVKKSKPKIVKQKAEVSQKTTYSTESLSKDNLIKKVSGIFNSNDPMIEGNVITINYRDGRYTLKVVKKKQPFKFCGYDIKDFNKREIIRELSKQINFQNGCIDSRGNIGFTDGTNYFSIDITRKRS